MTIAETLLADLQAEAPLTRKILERVPLEQKDWKPHAKSMSIGRLATHIAEIPMWVNRSLEVDEFDFALQKFEPRVAGSSEELLQIFDEAIADATAALAGKGDAEMEKLWAVKRAGIAVFEMPKKTAIRKWALSHSIHHRGQLSVLLRLLDVPVPGMYGPSADER